MSASHICSLKKNKINKNPSAVNIPKALTVKSKYHFLPKGIPWRDGQFQSRWKYAR